MTTTATKVTTIAETMGDDGVIVYANGSLLFVWDRKQTITAWDTFHRRSAGEHGAWGWIEYEVGAIIGLDDADECVDQDLPWAMDKAADWYDEHGEEF